MNKLLDILPTFAEHGHVASIIVSSPTKDAISDVELADALREYADYLSYVAADETQS